MPHEEGHENEIPGPQAGEGGTNADEWGSLSKRQKYRLHSLEKRGKGAKAGEKAGKYLEGHVSEYEKRIREQAQLLAMQKFKDIEALKAKIAAKEHGLTEAERRQMAEGSFVAAAQQQSQSDMAAEQAALASGGSPLTPYVGTPQGGDISGEHAAKGFKTAYIAHLAKQTEAQMQLIKDQNMMMGYNVPIEGAEDMWMQIAQLIAGTGTAVAGAVIGEDGLEGATPKTV